VPSSGLLWALAAWGAFVCMAARTGPTLAQERTAMTQEALSESTVIEFLRRFDELADKKDFGLIADMVHERAVFRFNDGDFVGRQAVKGAFEKTWRSGTDVRNERFYLSDIVVLWTDAASASATYTYNWEGERDGRALRIQGRGTRVIVRAQGRLQIIHEHLSRFPKPN
jgi:ketosteroid isomerase-like protein